VFSLLVCLIENRDRVVSKDELIELVWEGRIVSDGTLNTRINAARKAVGDDGKAQAVIKTFPRRGFRFVAQVNGDEEVRQDHGLNSTHVSDKPSIVVLPFFNLSGDPEQEYFSDGITEDIITALGRIRLFFVVARNTTFTYKGQAVDIPAMAKDLGVRYVLEGSVRKAGGRVRITVQLNDGETGNQLWAEHYDRDLEDIFAVQDEITQRVVGAIEPALEKAERDRATIANPNNLDAWDYYHRGMSHLYDKGEVGQPNEMIMARENFLKAIELDPQFSRAYSGLAASQWYHAMIGMTDDSFQILEEATSMAKKAIELDQEDAYAHGVLGIIYHYNHQPEAAIRECRSAIEIDPSFSRGYLWLGISMICFGQSKEGIEYIETALRIGKRDPSRGAAMVWLAMGHLFLGEYEKAEDLANKSLSVPSTQFWGNAALTAALSYLDKVDEAIVARQELQRRKPNFTCKLIKEKGAITDLEYQDVFLDGLRKAGIPEE
tara:strand:+ start:1364 stop:2836 length:1473 start_codon:yes stop_codon:yes gene_type:complete